MANFTPWANFKRKTTDTQELKNLSKASGLVFLGILIYLLVPTILRGVFKMKIEGWKGFWIGLISSLVVGAIVNSTGIMAGAMVGSGSHLIYKYLNEPIKKMTGSQIFPFDRTLVEETIEPIDQENETLTDRADYLLSDDARVGLNPANVPSGFYVDENGAIRKEQELTNPDTELEIPNDDFGTEPVQELETVNDGVDAPGEIPEPTSPMDNAMRLADNLFSPSVEDKYAEMTAW